MRYSTSALQSLSLHENFPASPTGNQDISTSNDKIPDPNVPAEAESAQISAFSHQGDQRQAHHPNLSPTTAIGQRYQPPREGDRQGQEHQEGDILGNLRLPRNLPNNSPSNKDFRWRRNGVFEDGACKYTSLPLAPPADLH